MSTTARFAAVDLGASSGRVMVGEVGPDSLELRAAARFPNQPVREHDGLHWDLDGLIDHAIDGLAKAYADGPLASIGIDAWGVDYGLLDSGTLMRQPFHYRDERRNEVGPGVVAAEFAAHELFARNGLNDLSFNTVYQLAADPSAASADHLLLIPDLVAQRLSGALVTERTNASTTGLLDVHTREWDTELIRRLGFDVRLFSDLVDPGYALGDLLPTVSDRVGGSIPVVAVGSHDTASAVVGAPMDADDAAYVSLGTWALVGLELDAPVLSDDARRHGFTNEGGVDGTFRFLANVMGTWLLSETLRSWGGARLGPLLSQAAELDGPVTLVDVQDPRFLPPGDMSGRIAAWCAEHDVPAPEGRVAVVRCIMDSVAAAIAKAVEDAASLSGRSIGTVHVVGGGAQNSLLCQAVADRSGRPVLAGPVEATAVGNVLVQARAAGLVGPDLADLRSLVARTHELVRYQPRS